MILVRATKPSPATIAFADSLRQGSGQPVAFLLDGRHPVGAALRLPAVRLTEEACRQSGLHCPPHFQWRCGDYGLYLARQQFRQVKQFWLIEHDIRLAGGPLQDFFAFFAKHQEVEFLACRLAPAQIGWHWYRTAVARDVQPFRCVFNVVRVSASALDMLLAKRQAHSRQFVRRSSWPNDEAFVATTLANSGRPCPDINGFGRTFYDDETLSLTNAIRGETFNPPDQCVRLYHPVLFGSDFELGNTTVRVGDRPGVWQRSIRRLNAFARW